KDRVRHPPPQLRQQRPAAGDDEAMLDAQGMKAILNGREQQAALLPGHAAAVEQGWRTVRDMPALTQRRRTLGRAEERGVHTAWPEIDLGRIGLGLNEQLACVRRRRQD